MRSQPWEKAQQQECWDSQDQECVIPKSGVVHGRGVVHGTKSDVVHGAKIGGVHGTKSGVVHGTKSGGVHWTKNGVVHGTKSSAVHGAKNGVVHGAKDGGPKWCVPWDQVVWSMGPSGVAHGTKSGMVHTTKGWWGTKEQAPVRDRARWVKGWAQLPRIGLLGCDKWTTDEDIF